MSTDDHELLYTHPTLFLQEPVNDKRGERQGETFPDTAIKLVAMTGKRQKAILKMVASHTSQV